MKQLLKLTTLFSLPVTFAWLVITIFVDAIAVPTVFRNVSKLEEAGKVGMKIFSTFNHLEFLFALVFIMGAIGIYKQSKKQVFLILSLILLVWSVMYNLYFTPQIIHYTELIHKANPMSMEYIKYQEAHAYYHNLYRYLDSTKIFLLLGSVIALSVLAFKKDKEGSL
jgi:hypothetical protein